MARKRRESTEPTYIERARRAQLIGATVELVAERGYAGASLAAIAEHAGITKAAVLYHFRSKDALVEAAQQEVLRALVADVSAAIEEAGTRGAPAAYVRSMIGHLREHPRHTRMIVESLVSGSGEHARAERWGPLADLLASARAAAGAPPLADARTLAVITGGAIDAIVAERLEDPAYDTAAAADRLAAMLESALEA
ncbi:TetR/AcrR family transcriptional regulator [Nocardiopsis coralliicola]